MAAKIIHSIRAALDLPKQLPKFLKWDSEELFVSGEVFFNALVEAIQGAQSTIWLEFYILKDDVVSQRVLDALVEAAQRGVDVRLIIDGVGSQEWIRKKQSQYDPTLAIKVYRPIPFGRLLKYMQRLQFTGIGGLFRRVNRRTHRKLAIIDKKKAFVGSMNLCAEPVESVFGNMAWQETAVAVSGRALISLVESFEETWCGRHERTQRQFSALVRDNRTLVQRLRNHHRLLRELAHARKRIYITTAYFIPERRLRVLLRRAARRGVDVRIIAPASSDIFFLPWVSRLYYSHLKTAGVQVFEYQKSMIHSKTMIVDSTAWIGSSNLNSRSLYWDRELDVRVLKKTTIAGLLQQFERDQANALLYEPWLLERFAFTRLFGLLLVRLKKLF